MTEIKNIEIKDLIRFYRILNVWISRKQDLENRRILNKINNRIIDFNSIIHINEFRQILRISECNVVLVEPSELRVWNGDFKPSWTPIDISEITDTLSDINEHEYDEVYLKLSINDPKIKTEIGLLESYRINFEKVIQILELAFDF